MARNCFTISQKHSLRKRETSERSYARYGSQELYSLGLLLHYNLVYSYPRLFYPLHSIEGRQNFHFLGLQSDFILFPHLRSRHNYFWVPNFHVFYKSQSIGSCNCNYFFSHLVAVPSLSKQLLHYSPVGRFLDLCLLKLGLFHHNQNNCAI